MRSYLLCGVMLLSLVLPGATSYALADTQGSEGTESSPMSQRQERAARPRMLFVVSGVQSPEDEAKLKEALATVEGIGDFRLRRTPRGLMLGIRGGTASREAVTAAVQAAGFEARPRAPFRRRPRGGREGEIITPAAPGERIRQDLTKVGDLAPDFTLITADGKEKVTLSDFRGKKPVVLIFGSYT